MEKKGTLNESIKNRRILTEGNLSRIMKRIKAIDIAAMTNKLQRFAGESSYKMTPQTEGLGRTVNDGLDELVSQITTLSKGGNVPVEEMMKVSVIMKNYDSFVDSFVDLELVRLKVLDKLTAEEITKVKQWIKGKQLTLGTNIQMKLNQDIQDVLVGLKNQYHIHKDFTTLSNFMGATMNSEGFTDMLLGLLRLDGDYYASLDGSLDKLLGFHKIVNKKWPIGTKDIDGVDIAGQDMWPQFKNKWNATIKGIGKKNGVDGLDQKKIVVDGVEVYDLKSIKNSINTIIKTEIKNKKGVNLFKTKYRSKINSLLRRKKTKNIPKVVSKKSGGKITEADVSEAIIVDTGKGMDIFIVKDKKSREQLMTYFKDEGIKHGDLIGWVTGNKGALEGGKDISQINKRIKFRIWVGVVIPAGYAASALTFYLWCDSKTNGTAYTDEEKRDLATMGIKDPGGKARKILNCGEKAWSFPFNLAMLWVDDIINKEVYPELALVINEINKQIKEACDKYKEDNEVPCCNIDCDGDIGDEEFRGSIKKTLAGAMKMPKIKEALEDSGQMLSDVIKDLDKNNLLNGLFTADGQQVSIDDLIKHQCRKMVNTKDNVKCVEDFLKTTWSDLVNFKNIKDNECDANSIRNHINTKIGILEKYKQYITFDNVEDNKFNIQQKNLPGSLQEWMVGKIVSLDDLKKGYLKIVDGLVTQLCNRVTSSGVEEAGDVEAVELTRTYKTLKDMVMDLYGKEIWGVNCDDYDGWTDDDVEDSMYLHFLSDWEDGVFSSEQGYWGQVGDAFNWWYPRYKVLCAEGDVDDGDIDGPDNEDIDDGDIEDF
jgi:hypothetical protein